MKAKIEKAAEIGFCFGVRRAIEIIEKAAKQYGRLETLGAVVHNEQVLQRLNSLGVDIVNSVGEAGNEITAVSSHGVSPEIESRLREKSKIVIDTTCSFVRRAQIAAKKLAEEGFFVIIYGEAMHAEVKGILGWAQEKGLATLDTSPIREMQNIPRKLGILSQTTQIPENFTGFVKEIVEIAFQRDSEIRILDTICPGVRKRQLVSLELAGRADLILVIGGRSSANTRRLLDLCSEVTEAHLISNEDEIDSNWFKGKKYIGVTSGTSTPEETIDEIIERIKMKI
jgi:4-hydroxy-3-methylbut-2-enyl diphosphate reductase